MVFIGGSMSGTIWYWVRERTVRILKTGEGVPHFSWKLGLPRGFNMHKRSTKTWVSRTRGQRSIFREKGLFKTLGVGGCDTIFTLRKRLSIANIIYFCYNTTNYLYSWYFTSYNLSRISHWNQTRNLSPYTYGLHLVCILRLTSGYICLLTDLNL